MDLIFVTDSLSSTQPLIEVAHKLGHRVLKYIGSDDEVAHYVESMHPDALIFICNEIDRTALREMRSVSEKSPTPILVFTRDTDAASIDAAVKAGASSFVVDCDDSTRLGSLLDVAKVRFKEQQRLINELQQTKKALNERKTIEKAKGIIMQTKNLNEDQAYNAMRKLAMSHNKSIAELAEQIITAAEVLV